MHKKIHFFCVVLMVILFCTCLLAQSSKKGGSDYKTISGSPSQTMININNVSTYFSCNGNSDIKGGQAGFEYPKKRGKTVFYESGLIWGGMIGNYWATGGSAYRSGLQPGRIMPDGTAEDQNSAAVRIYRVRSDYKNFADDEEKKLLFADEISMEGKTADEIFAQYNLDWIQWPAAYGAPYIDKDKDGIYNPQKDIPGMSESPCQTIWFVANDLDSTATKRLYGALPMKLEMQATYWALKGEKPNGNAIYRRYKVINRNSKKIDSMYLCMWSDPDIGDGSDDYCGCDTTISLGYMYNGRKKDASYDITPPAAGFLMLQSPYVAGNAQDAASCDMRTLPGYRNLDITVFYMNSHNYGIEWGDPLEIDYRGSLQLKNWFNGKTAKDGIPFTNPTTGKVTKYYCSGDPATGAGWIDGTAAIPMNDRRFGMVSGPFTMNPSDTQQIIVAQFAAGGSGKIDNVNAVTILKQYSKTIAKSWKSNLQFLQPISPEVKVAELERKLILSWTDSSSIAKCEKDLNKVYKFQGYNIYQFPKSDSQLYEGVLLCTYDVVDNYTLINGWTEDRTTGFLENKTIGFGSNSGIRRYYSTTKDVINNGRPLYNFSKYYFGVTAYYVADDPEMMPRIIESPLRIITALPQTTEPGVRYPYAADELLPIRHTTGDFPRISAFAAVVDPTKGDGKTYDITVAKNSSGKYTWSLFNGSTILAADLAVASDSAAALNTASDPIAGGVQFHVFGLGRIPSSFDAVKGTNPYKTDGSSSLYMLFNGELWGGDFCLGQHWYSGTTLPLKSVNMDSYHPITMKFASTTNTGAFSAADPNASFGYRYLRAAGAAAKASFAPFIKEAVTNYGFQEFGLNGNPNIPCAVYDNTTGKRLCLMFAENNSAAGTVDGIYFPPTNRNDGPREFLFILNSEYSKTADPSIAKFGTSIYTDKTYPIMYFITACRSKDAWSNADEIVLSFADVTSSINKWSITLSAPTTSADLIKEDVNRINVFPNPYYGVNSQENNPYQRFVTFTHLPARATIKIFNVSGQLVRILEKDSQGQTLQWNLATDNNWFVASGIYVAYISMPDLGKVKILKFAVIVEQQYPLHF